MGLLSLSTLLITPISVVNPLPLYDLPHHSQLCVLVYPLDVFELDEVLVGGINVPINQRMNNTPPIHTHFDVFLFSLGVGDETSCFDF